MTPPPSGRETSVQDSNARLPTDTTHTLHPLPPSRHALELLVDAQAEYRTHVSGNVFRSRTTNSGSRVSPDKSTLCSPPTFSSLRSLRVSFVELFLEIMLRNAGEADTTSSPSPSLSAPSSSEMSCLLLVGVGVEMEKLFDLTMPRRSVPSPTPPLLLAVTAAGGPMLLAGLENSFFFFLLLERFPLVGHLIVTCLLQPVLSLLSLQRQPGISAALSAASSQPPLSLLCSRTSSLAKEGQSWCTPAALCSSTTCD